MAEMFSFQTAVKAAVENSPRLSPLRGDLQIRELEFTNAFSSFFPQLDLGAVHGLRGASPSPYSSSLVSEFNLEATENIYDNGQSWTRYESAKIAKEIADLSYRHERDKLTLEFANEYMRYSLSKALFEVQQQQFSIVNKQYQSVSSQFRQGVKTRRDYLRFKTELRRSEIDLQSATTAVERSRVELMRLMGVELRPGVAVYEFQPIEIEPGAVVKAPDAAPHIESHFLYRISNLQKQIFENDTRLVKRQFGPEVFFTAGASYHTGDYLGSTVSVTSNESTSWNALLTLKFNLIDWGARRRNIAIANVKQAQGESGLAVAVNSFAADSAKLMLDLGQSTKSYALAKELLDLESQSYGFLDSEYRNGKVSYLDIIVGLRDLLNSKVQMYSSYFDLRTQLLRYRYYEGRLYDSVLEK
jgi:outer membrane protein TolC